MNDQLGMMKQGNAVYRAVKIEEPQIEVLRMLQTHPGWITYQKILSAQRDNVLFGLMSSEVDQDKYAKRVGRAEGLHLAATTLDSLVRDFDERARRVAGESTNQSARNGQTGKE